MKREKEKLGEKPGRALLLRGMPDLLVDVLFYVLFFFFFKALMYRDLLPGTFSPGYLVVVSVLPWDLFFKGIYSLVLPGMQG